MSEQNLKEAIRNYKELQRLAEELEQEYANKIENDINGVKTN